MNIERSEAAADADDREAHGFLAGLSDGWHGLTTFVTGAATALGLLLPFALLFGLVGTPLWLASRVVRRRRTTEAAAVTPSDAG